MKRSTPRKPILVDPASPKPVHSASRRHRLALVIGSIVSLAMAGTLVLIQSRRPAASWNAQPRHYVATSECEGCHQDIASTFSTTAMGQSFYKPALDPATSDATFRAKFFHTASRTWFAMERDASGLYQKRWQIGPDGKPANMNSESVDYVMGSGQHVRTYLHRDAIGTLTELPMAWYSEGGGTWAMNPGFDNPHPPARHKIAYECMFCHNGYPSVPQKTGDPVAYPVYSGELPQGIDCQRCHGPGSEHVQAARTPGVSLALLHSTILNPDRLPAERQSEVCMQCHLEVTSRHLPDRLRSYDRPVFGYSPDQPLSSFMHYFQRDTGGKTDTSFEIVSAPYRLRQSKCFLGSSGALTCELCHNPHKPHQTPAAEQHYTAVCLGCHSQALQRLVVAKKHTAQNDCTTCHMPLRRTDDVVHVTITDHLIQRVAPPASVRLAAKREPSTSPEKDYRGPVLPYRLTASASDQNDLYLAAAQVIHDSNVAGIPHLASLIATLKPAQPDFAIELGDALRRNHCFPEAIAAYRDALAVDPHSLRARRSLGIALASYGDTAQATTEFNTALQEYPEDPLLWYHLGWVQASQGQLQDAVANFNQALALDPDLADAYENLGIAKAMLGDHAAAEAAMRQALRIEPYDASFADNLRKLLQSP